MVGHPPVGALEELLFTTDELLLFTTDELLLFTTDELLLVGVGGVVEELLTTGLLELEGTGGS